MDGRDKPGHDVESVSVMTHFGMSPLVLARNRVQNDTNRAMIWVWPPCEQAPANFPAQYAALLRPTRRRRPGWSGPLLRLSCLSHRLGQNCTVDCENRRASRHFTTLVNQPI